VPRLRDLAGAARAQNRLADAESALERAVALAPEVAEIQAELADVRFRIGKLEQALSSYSAACRLKPGFPTALHAQWGAATARAWLEQPIGAAQSEGRVASPYGEKVSIVICSNNRAKFDKVEADFRGQFSRVDHEIIGIHDARSLCEGYNRGVDRSRGEIVIFAHDDIRIASPDFATKILSSLETCDVVGVAGTTRLRSVDWTRSGWPFLAGQVGNIQPDGKRVVTLFGLHARLVLGAQALDGLFFAARRTVFGRVRFDEATFDGWHFYDLDFTYSAYLTGLRLGIRTDALLWHESVGRFDDRWRHYAARFLRKHAARLAHDDDEAGSPPQIIGVTIASEDEWIAVTRHLFA
jgi:hypothetical protein